MQIVQRFAAGSLCAALVGCATLRPQPAGECFWSGTAEVWADTNADGVHDPEEMPVADVLVSSTHAGVTINKYHTGADGTTGFGAISTSCDWAGYQVSVEVPTGYTLPGARQIPFSAVGEGGTAQFGLVPNATPTPAVTPTATVTAISEPVGECFWSATVDVWQDNNADGVRDPGEPSLPNISVRTTYSNGNDVEIENYKTGANGQVVVGAISNVCDWENWSVEVLDIGYEPTNPATGTLRFSNENNGSVLSFGLRRVVTPIIPTQASAEFGDCDVMSREQAESILGPLDEDPFPLEAIGGDDSLTIGGALCIFGGRLNTASVGYSWFREAANARAAYEEVPGEPVGGIGDEAKWIPDGLTLSVLRGTLTLTVRMESPDNAREQAIRIGQIAVVRIP